MDINQVKFGSYAINSSVLGNKKDLKKETANKETTTQSNQNVEQFNPDGVLSALNAQGLQNMAQISVAKKEINPKDYLSDERIADIEAMMGKFNDGVEQTANIVGNELPFVSEDMKYALAAQVFAKE